MSSMFLFAVLKLSHAISPNWRIEALNDSGFRMSGFSLEGVTRESHVSR